MGVSTNPPQSDHPHINHPDPLKNTPPPEPEKMSVCLILVSLVSLLPSHISSLPESVSTSCSSQTCKDCLGSCDGCDQCALCSICPERLGICEKCKYCKNGPEACKKTCQSGKTQPVCKKCIENC